MVEALIDANDQLDDMMQYSSLSSNDSSEPEYSNTTNVSPGNLTE
jgi:hypothetical protein